MIGYRVPGLDDALALANLARETFHETFAQLYAPEDLNAFYARSKTQEAAALAIADQRSPILVAEHAGELVAYCKVSLDACFEDYPAPGKKLVELKELYVRSSHQGSGVARHLMLWALETTGAAEPDEMVLSVWSGNHKAQAFYRKHGFDWVADTHFMVGNQRDEEFLFMRTMQD